jgi:hypothetical protein
MCCSPARCRRSRRSASRSYDVGWVNVQGSDQAPKGTTRVSAVCGPLRSRVPGTAANRLRQASAFTRVFPACSRLCSKDERIGLLGALANQDILQRLQQLSDKLDQLASSKARPRRSRRHNRVLRPGSVLVAVTQVLAAAEGPMPVCAISKAVSDLLGLPVSRSSVKNCLARQAQGERGRFARTDRGHYQIRRAG